MNQSWMRAGSTALTASAIALVLCGLGCGEDDSASSHPKDEAPSEPGKAPRDEGPIEIPATNPGGQSGAEGSCPGPPVEQLPFALDDALALVEGEHETTVAWRPWWSPDASEAMPMRVKLTVRGEPRVVLDCGGSVAIDVDVELALPGAPLIRCSATANVWSANEGRLLVDLDPMLAEYLELPAPVPTNHDGDPFRLELWFYPEGVRGSLGTFGPNYFLCTVAAWPADSVCRRGVELDDGPASDADVEAVLERANDVKLLAMSWEDGREQSVQVAITRRAEAACHWPDTLSIGSNEPATGVSIPVDIQLTSDDGTLDISLRADLLAQKHVDGQWAPRTLIEGKRFAPADAFGDLARDVAADTLVDLVLSGRVSADRANGSLQLLRVDADASIPSFQGAIEQANVPCFGESQPLSSAQWTKAP